MAREQGTFKQSANYEVQKEGTIDARQFVEDFADILTFTPSNYIRIGFPVTVANDSVIEGITYKRGWYQYIGGALSNANSWEFMGGGETPTLQELVDAAQNISDVIIEFLGGHALENDGSGKQLSLKGTVAIESKGGTNQLQVSDNGVRIIIGEATGSAGEALLTDGSKLYYGAYNYNNLDNLPDLSVFDNVDTFPTVGDFPAVGKEDVFYIDNSTGKLYRWNGTGYSIVAGDLALGETASTAYRGDRGKIAYDHSQAAHAPANAQKNSDIISSEITNSLGFTPENVGNKGGLSNPSSITYPTTQEVTDALETKQPKDLVYPTIADMIAAPPQLNQVEGVVIRVDDAGEDSRITFPIGTNRVAYYQKLAGSTASLIDDYVLIGSAFGIINRSKNLTLGVDKKIDMSNPFINLYNFDSPSSVISLLTENSVIGGKAIIRVNANTASNPNTVTVNGSNTGRICEIINWQDNVDMEIYLQYTVNGLEWWYYTKKR